jgi:hypothetical protein
MTLSLQEAQTKEANKQGKSKAHRSRPEEASFKPNQSYSTKSCWRSYDQVVDTRRVVWQKRKRM